MKEFKHWLSFEFWQEISAEAVRWAVHTLPKVAVVLFLAFLFTRLLKFVGGKIAEHARQSDMASERTVEAQEREKRVGTLVGIVSMAGSIAIWVMTGILLLTQIGVNVAPLIAGAGIVGLAVGFGAQELVRDLITGFFMLLENQVRQGDVAIINGQGGLVESIGLRTIRVRDQSGVVHVFQNGKISSLSNMTKDWSAMVFNIGVAYKEDTDEVVSVMKEVGEDLRSDADFAPSILEELEVFGVDSFGDSAVVIRARFKTRPSDQWNVGREFNRRLKKAFDERGIEIPFPHRTLFWGGGEAPLPETPALEAKSGRPA